MRGVGPRSVFIWLTTCTSVDLPIAELTFLYIARMYGVTYVTVKPGTALPSLHQCNQTLGVDLSRFIHSSARKTVHHYVTRLLRKIVKSDY
jgi:hypothetical protein